MVRNNRGNLSHHEELRYNYLLRNLSYLNAKEKQEFDYLYNKKKSTFSEPSYSNGQSYYREEPDNSYEAAYDDYSSAADQPQENYTSQGLPVYPEESRASKRSSRRGENNIPNYQEEPAYYQEQANAYQGVEQAYAAPVPTSHPKKLKNKRPRKKGGVKRFFKYLGILILLVVIGMIAMFIKGMNDVSSGKTNYTPAVTETFNGKNSPDGTNILILGSDQRVTQGSSDARTDTIMVLNIGNKSGKVKMVSFMRDTLVNIEGVSYGDYSYDQKLNVAFNIGEQNNNQGAELMRETLKRNFDINIKYYVMVDFQTFAEAIDTLFPNGVKMNAKFGLVNGESVSSVEVPDDLNMKDGVVPNQTIKVGQQRMDGRTLLNYARFRKDDDGDFGRTRRQQEVMSAIFSQIKDPTKLFTGSAAIGKIYSLTSTNISYPFLIKEGLGVLTSGKSGIEQTTIPAEGDWVDDYDMYGGKGISIDFDKYQKKLADLGLR